MSARDGRKNCGSRDHVARDARGILAFVAIAFVLAAPHLAFAGTVVDRLALPGHVSAFVNDARDLGAADPSMPLSLVVVLKLADEAGLRAAAEAVAVGAAPLSHDEVVARFSPSESTLARVVEWLRSEGLVVGVPSDDRTLVPVTTTVAGADLAFGVDVRHFGVGIKTIVGISRNPTVPMDLAPFLQGIVGLTVPPVWTHNVARVAASSPNGGAHTFTSGSPPYDPTDLRNAYDVQSIINAGHNGAGKVAAVETWGPADQSNLNTYDSTFGLPAATITTHAEGGGSTCALSGDTEWDLDVQMEHALSPSADLHVYCASSASTSDLLTVMGQIISANLADVVDQSWGSCEYFVDSSTAGSYETKYSQASAQGQAFFTSSGDSGSRECLRFSNSYNFVSAGWPTTAPHTTSVGGTSLTMSGSSYVSETAWNTCTPCSDGTYEATGGVPSSLYDRPTWENVGGSGRSSGDVSAVGDPNTGVYVRSGGYWWEIGGTSVSAPLWASYWADVVHATGRRGNAAEALWNVAGGSSYGSLFHDVTGGTDGDYSAGSGYDYPTGWGSMKGSALLNSLTVFTGGVFVASGNLKGSGGSEIITGAGAGGGPRVRAFNADNTDHGEDFFAYNSAFGGGVRVASCDVDGDGKADIITEAGPGGGPHVRVFSGADLHEIYSFFAYDPNFTGGVYVACGDVDGDGKADIITGAGAGGGPHVRVFSGADLHEIYGFFAYDPSFSGGVYVAGGDINGDGHADIITGAGAGGGPHVRAFSGVDLSQLASFFAYDPNFSGGVRVAAGDLNGDGKADIITGAGAGGGPHVRAFSGADLSQLASFFAYDPSFSGGVFVAAGNIDGAGGVEIITGAGAGGGPHVRAFTGSGSATSTSFMAY